MRIVAFSIPDGNDENRDYNPVSIIIHNQENDAGKHRRTVGK